MNGVRVFKSETYPMNAPHYAKALRDLNDEIQSFFDQHKDTRAIGSGQPYFHITQDGHFTLFLCVNYGPA
jgi:hypothetical protein